MKRIWTQHNFFFSVITLYFLLRLISLTAIPIFNDEAIYLDWGWRETHLPNALFFSLYDGKQPFLMWIFGISENIFYDSLFAGRIISVVTGFLSLVGIYKLTKRYFDQRTGLLASLFYILIPIFSLFDRQALMESAVTATVIWSCYYFLALLEKHRTKYVLLLGLTLGISFFIKSTIIIFFLLIIILTIFFVYTKKTKNHLLGRDILSAICLSQILLIPLYFQEQYWKTLSMNNRYSLTFLELMHFPFLQWGQNIVTTVQIVFWHSTPFIFFATFIGVVLTLWQHNMLRRVIAAWFVGGLLLFILFVRDPSPRYVISFLPFVTIFAAQSLVMLYKKRRIPAIVFGIFIITTASFFTLLQIFSPLQYFTMFSTFTKYSDKVSYVSHWTSGYGVTEAKDYLLQKSAQTPIAVGVRLDAGNPENAMFTYFNKEINIKTIYFDSSIISPNVSSFDCIHAPIPLYFVSRDIQLAGLNNFLQEEKRFYKPEGDAFVGVYRLKTDCKGKTLSIQ